MSKALNISITTAKRSPDLSKSLVILSDTTLDLPLFDQSMLVMTFLTNLEILRILFSFRLVLEGKVGKEIPQSSRLAILENFSVNNLALSDAEDKLSWSSNRGGITDLPSLRTLLTIRQKSHGISLGTDSPLQTTTKDFFVSPESLEMLQLQAKFQTAMVVCSRFIWITNSSDRRRV